MASGKICRWRVNIVILWIVVCSSKTVEAREKESNRRCRHFSTTESFEIGRSKGKLLELHLRHNLEVSKQFVLTAKRHRGNAPTFVVCRVVNSYKHLCSSSRRSHKTCPYVAQ